MPRESPLGFDLSGPGLFESLCCSSVGLYFWHNLLLLVKYDSYWRKGDRETKKPRRSPAQSLGFWSLEWSQDRDEISPLKLGILFNLSKLLYPLNNPLDHVSSKVRMGQLSPSENHCDLDLISFFQETLNVPELELKIVVLCLRPHLHLFEVNDGLLLLCIMGLLLLLVFKFSIIHDATDRWLRFRGNLHQVQFRTGSHTKGLKYG